MTSEDEEFGVGGPLELNEANVVAVQDQLKVDTPTLLSCPHPGLGQAEIDSLKKWLNECGQQVQPPLPRVTESRVVVPSVSSGASAISASTVSVRERAGVDIE